jgi:hypothetical protein
MQIKGSTYAIFDTHQIPPNLHFASPLAKQKQNKTKEKVLRFWNPHPPNHSNIFSYSSIHIRSSHHTNLMYVLLCFKKSLNHSMNPFFAQITKDIRFKPNHQMYP